jgi:hypothetical protein
MKIKKKIEISRIAGNIFRFPILLKNLKLFKFSHIFLTKVFKQNFFKFGNFYTFSQESKITQILWKFQKFLEILGLFSQILNFMKFRNLAKFHIFAISWFSWSGQPSIRLWRERHQYTTSVLSPQVKFYNLDNPTYGQIKLPWTIFWQLTWHWANSTSLGVVPGLKGRFRRNSQLAKGQVILPPFLMISLYHVYTVRSCSSML